VRVDTGPPGDAAKRVVNNRHVGFGLGDDYTVCVGEVLSAVESDCCATVRGWSCGSSLGAADVFWTWFGSRCIGAYVYHVKLGKSEG